MFIVDICGVLIFVLLVVFVFSFVMFVFFLFSVFQCCLAEAIYCWFLCGLLRRRGLFRCCVCTFFSILIFCVMFLCLFFCYFETICIVFCVGVALNVINSLMVGSALRMILIFS